MAVLVLLGLSIALGVRRDREPSSGPKPSWAEVLAGKLAPDARLSLSEIEAEGCLDGTGLVLPKTVLSCTARILPGKSPVRKATLTLSGPDEFALNYQPAPEDKRAVPVSISRFTPGRPVDLVILKQGGTLTLTRKSSGGPAAIRIE